MTATLIVIMIALAIAALLYGIVLFNNLISLKNNVSKNWSNIDVLLKQRSSEIPKLIDTCKEYMTFEQETLQKVVQARQAVSDAREQKDLATLSAADTTLHQGLMKLFALAENYPNLKTNTSFMQLQGRISDLETAIADRRELYNDSVNLYNIRIQQFPDLIVAGLFFFKSSELMKFNPEELEDIDVNSRFKP